MQLALQEARKGLGRTSPNPSVGAVVVKNGKVVGRGYHQKAGLPHAEPNALRAAGNRTAGATLYVTLEPCNHTGRTAPCTDIILRSGIRRVVIGMADPNPRVTGGGAAFLASHGMEVSSGVLERQCREINLPFIKHSTTGLPWVIMKAGMSLDGGIAAVQGRSTMITSQRSRQQVHRIRDRVDAILVGIETVLMDDPSLTTRLAGGRRGKDPLRVVLDTGLRMPPGSKMLSQTSSTDTWIFCGPDPPLRKKAALEEAGASIKPVQLARNGFLDLKAVLSELGRQQLNSVLVEGGGKIHGSFLRENLVDQVFLFFAPIFLGAKAVPVVSFSNQAGDSRDCRLQIVRSRRFGDDIMIEGRFAH